MKRIVVGNGPSLLESKNGTIIDSFDEVVRLGGYCTTGFEEYVGTKADYWFALGRNMRQRKGLRRFTTTVAAQSLRKHSGDISKCAIQAAYFHADIPVNSKLRPTLGLIAIAHCFLEFGWPEITVAGFDHCQLDTKKHYWEEDTTKSIYTYHNEENERAFMEYFIRTGKVKRLCL